MKFVGMGVGPGDVDVSEPKVEVGRYAQRGQRLRGPSREATAPQRNALFGLRHGRPPVAGRYDVTCRSKSIRDAGGPPTATREAPRLEP